MDSRARIINRVYVCVLEKANQGNLNHDDRTLTYTCSKVVQKKIHETLRFAALVYDRATGEITDYVTDGVH